LTTNRSLRGELKNSIEMERKSSRCWWVIGRWLGDSQSACHVVEAW